MVIGYKDHNGNLTTSQEIVTDQVASLPTAGVDFVDKIYQYTGTTGNGLFNGRFYKCVNNSGTYSWEEIKVQASEINDTTASASTTYSSNKIGGLCSDRDISKSSTSTSFTLTDAADGNIQNLVIRGRTDSTTAESVGENGLTITTTDGTASSSATITTGLPLRSYSESVYDELDMLAGTVTTRCGFEGGVVTQLATPVVTPLSPSEITALTNLKTYSGTTNISATDSPNMTVNYLLNTDNGQAVANLDTKIKSGFDELKKESEHFVYSFYVDQNDSNPATCVRPYYNTKYGCDNLFYLNAYMDYTADKFNYGSWENFIKDYFKPCMLSYDGHVDYYLDPDDYEKKLDGGASDIKDMSYNGNVMVQVKTLWVKRWTTGGKYYCILSDRKLDKSFKAYAHHDIKGNICEFIYRAAYDGSYDGTRLRSISGVEYHNANALTVNKIMSNTTRQQEIDFAKANNTQNETGEGWNILHKAEWDLFNDVLLLIGMSTNTQATFGNGNISSYVSTSNTGILATGTMDKKGLFYGKSDNVSGVKVLGYEMPWGNIWKSCLGWILSGNQHLVKMTRGTEDGSTATDYNLDGTGYVATGKTITANGYISAFDGADAGFLPTAASGSSTTYMCDYVWQSTATYFALVGGYSGDGAFCGAFYATLHGSAAAASWGIGAALSYKPLAA